MTTKNLILKISEEQHRDIKTYAAENGRTIKDLMLDALQEVIGGEAQGENSTGKYKEQVDAVCSRLSEAMDFAMIAVSHLERIRKVDPRRLEALEKVETWISENKP